MYVYIYIYIYRERERERERERYTYIREAAVLLTEAPRWPAGCRTRTPQEPVIIFKHNSNNSILYVII